MISASKMTVVGALMVQLCSAVSSAGTLHVEDFTSGLPGSAQGWSYYSSHAAGRIEVVDGKLRMDSSQPGVRVINEAVLRINPQGSIPSLQFYHEHYGDESDALPSHFTGHADGDGISFSLDGVRWHTLVHPTVLDDAGGGFNSSAWPGEIYWNLVRNVDPDTEITTNFYLKFQQTDNDSYSNDGRAWDNINVQSPNLVVTFPHHVTESAGSFPVTVKTTESAPPFDVPFTITADPAGELSMPAPFFLTPSYTSHTFMVTVTDDAVADGPQFVRVYINGDYLGQWDIYVRVDDDEPNSISLTAPSSMTEDFTETATIMLAQPPTAPVRVYLSASTEGQLTLPAYVDIPAGETSATFDIYANNNDVIDGDRTVTVTAKVGGWAAAGASIAIEDNEAAVERVELATIADPQSTGKNIYLQALAFDANDNPIPGWSVPGTGTFSLVLPSGETMPLADNFGTYTSYNGWYATVAAGAAAQDVVARFTHSTLGTAESNPFDILQGDLTSFVVDALPPEQVVQQPFTVSVSALDPLGDLKQNYHGTAKLSALAGMKVTTFGSISSSSPTLYGMFQPYNEAVRLQTLYLPGDLAMTGTLHSIALYIGDAPPGVISNSVIRMKHTTRTHMYDAPYWESGGWQTVYQGDLAMPDTGWFTIPLQDPFSYNGTNSLFVDFSFTTTNPYEESSYVKATNVTDVRTVYGYDSIEYGHPTEWGANNWYSTSVSVPTMRFVQGSPVPVQPAALNFQNGLWSGPVAVGSAAASVSLLVEDEGVIGTSSPFEVTKIGDITVVVPASALEGSSQIGTVHVTDAPAADLTIALTSSSAADIGLPTPVTIAAGSTSVDFTFSILDDSELEVGESATITASVFGYAAIPDTIALVDNETTDLVLSGLVSPATAGQPVPVTLSIVDGTGQVWNNFNGTLALEGLVSPSSITFSGGVWSGSLTFYSAGEDRTLRAMDAGSLIGESDVFDVLAGPLDRFVWNTISSPQYPGQSFPVTIRASDAWSNTVPAFSGTVSLTGQVGEGDKVLGTGDVSSDYPINSYWHDRRIQAIYPAQDIGGARTVTGLVLQVTEKPGRVLNAFTIRMKHTTLSDYESSANWETAGWTTVLVSNLTVAATGALSLPFTTAFPYNGVDHLMIDFSFNNVGYTSGGGTLSTSNAVYRSIVYYSDSNDGDPLTWSSSTESIKEKRTPFITLLAGAPVQVEPATSGNFADGVWTGDVTVQGHGSGIVLTAKDDAAHTGRSNPFDVPNLATLEVTLPSAVTEGAGTLAGQGTATVLQALASDVTVSLASSDASELIVPASVVIPAGQTTATFDLTVVDDIALDLSRTVTVTATSASLAPGSAEVVVHDNENPTLTVSLQPFWVEGQGVQSVGIGVSLPVVTEFPLLVNLLSSDTTELTVPASVVIPAGTSGKAFTVTVVDDTEQDGAQSVTVSALAPWVQGGSASTEIRDNDVHHFAFSAIATPQRGGEAFDVSIQALDVNGTAIPTYAGVPTLSARAGDGSPVATIPGSATFSGGQWFGQVAVPAIGSGFKLVAASGTATGESALFDQVAGSAFSFAWDAIASPQTSGAPFSVRITAMDRHGFTANSFTGSVTIAGSVGESVAAIGNGTNGSVYPLSTYYKDRRSQIIYLKEQVGTARPLTALSLFVMTKPDRTLSNFTIRLKHTTLAAYNAQSEWETVGWTTVYQGHTAVTSTGWVQFAFSTPFAFDGVNNLLVDLSFNNNSYGDDDAGICRASTSSVDRVLAAQFDDTQGDPLGWNGLTPSPNRIKIVPDIRLGGGEAVAVTPTSSGAFNQGVWTGAVAVNSGGSNIFLVAKDPAGNMGLSGSFAVPFDDYRNLVVASAHGNVTPARGTNAVGKGIAVTAQVVDSPVVSGATQYACIGWTGSGDIPAAGTETWTSAIVSNDSTITWLWTTNYLLSFEGTGVTAWKPAGSTVQVTAPASNHHHFSHWSGDFTLVTAGTTNSQTLEVNMAGPVSLTPHYQVDRHSLQIRSTYGTPNPAVGTVTNDYGTSLTPSIAGGPIDMGSTQIVNSGWSMTGNTPRVGSGTSFSMTHTNNAVLTWLWQTNVQLTVTAGANGSVANSPTGWKPLGSTVALNPVPANAQYQFTEWTGDVPLEQKTHKPLYLLMDRTRSVTANFVGAQYSVVVQSEAGPVSPAPGTHVFAYGDTASFSVAQPTVEIGSTQYVAAGWTMSGNAPVAGSGQSFSATVTNHATLQWQWTKNVRFERATQGPGTISGASAGWHAKGSMVSVTAEPQDGSLFAGWTGDVAPSQLQQNPLTLTLDRARSVTARFKSRPTTPVVNPVATPTLVHTQLISGVKETNTDIRVNGAQVVAWSASTNWSHTANLVEGDNVLQFTSRDTFGLESDPVSVTISYSNKAPGAVSITANGEGKGTEIALDWNGYDNAANGGDIARFDVYRADAAFTDLAQAAKVATVQAGTKSVKLTGLERDHTYHVAVAAVDHGGKASPVSSMPVATEDTMAPAKPGATSVQCFADHLVLSWSPVADTDSDLAGYRVYSDGEASPAEIQSPTFDATGLLPAKSYTFTVASIDSSGNESSGTQVTGVTLLPNPATVNAEPQHQKVALSWSAVEPAALVKHYAVYVHPTDFTSVAGLTPAITVAGTGTVVNGLQNGVTSYFAVVTVNISSGRAEQVSAIAAKPTPDSISPVITSLKYDGTDLVDGATLAVSGVLSVKATDASGVKRVEYLVDGQPVKSLTTATGGAYNWTWALEQSTDGSHIVEARVFDAHENQTSTVRSVTVNLALPATAPTITAPANGTILNVASTLVQGSAKQGTDVVLYNNGSPIQMPGIDATTADKYAGAAPLVEGTNRLQAAMRNRNGSGPLSSAVTVLVDTTVPAAPFDFTATSRDAGQISLAWQKPAGISVKGYNVYRSSSEFTTTGVAVKVNANLITGTTYTDMPTQDGAYFYAVTAVNLAGTESLLSPVASAVSDRVLPSASLVATPFGKHDAATGRFGAGIVKVQLTVNEPTLTPPFLSLVPNGGVPMIVTLEKKNDLLYEGALLLKDGLDGTAYFNFSARDLVGNRGTVINAGATILVDTAGPDVTALILNPASPIENNAAQPSVVIVTLVLDDVIKTGTSPQVAYSLSGQVGASLPVALAKVDETTWSGSFTLPESAGTPAEYITFSYSGTDDLDNTSTKIRAPNLFEVYQGDLPALASPYGLIAESQPAGRILLTWSAIDGAQDYQIFRQAPGEGSLTPYQRTGAVVEFTDEPSVEGVYNYAIASVRSANGKEAIGEKSPVATAMSDATPPGAPTGLNLVLAGNGIQVNWTAPSFTEPVTYSLYRSSASTITSVSGLDALAEDISVVSVVDPHPSKLEHAYTVTAKDASGNESAPAESQYLNVKLLPINSLQVTLTNGAAPVLSWTHPYPADVATYDVVLGTNENSFILNPAPLTVTRFSDTGYSGDDRDYTVVAFDPQGVASPGRTIRLPTVSASHSAEAQLKRGVMNRLTYIVTNASSAEVKSIRVRTVVGSQTNISAKVDLPAGGSAELFTVIGGVSNLPDTASVRSTVEITPRGSELVSIVSTSSLPVGDDAMPVNIINSNITRGTDNEFRWTLVNTSPEAVEIVTATGSGKNASPDVRFKLLDKDNNVYSTAKMQQSVGAKVVTLINLDTVARIEPGETYVSDPVKVFVPTNVPDHAVIQLEIDRIYYHRALPDEARMNGVTARGDLALIDTPYYAEVTNVNPGVALGGQDITIQGRAISRETAQPLPNAPVKLVISSKGFDRVLDVMTDANGDFSYVFSTLPTESGSYSVWALHPELNNRYAQAQFVVSKVFYSPSVVNVTLPTGHTQDIKIAVTAGDGTTVQNLRLVDVTEALPSVVKLQTGAPVASLSGGKSSSLVFTLSGSSVTSGVAMLRLASDESGAEGWGSIAVHYAFAQSKPAMYSTPGYLQTGVGLNQSRVENITLENRGLEALRNVQLVLLTETDQPVPSWVTLAVPSMQDDIEPGAKRSVGLQFAPPAGTQEKVHKFKLLVLSGNAEPFSVNLFVSVTQSGRGAVQFTVTDMYTFTLDKSGALIQGVQGAKIGLQHETVESISTNLVTDKNGDVIVNDLPAGWYRYKITGNKHYPYYGRLEIKPGITVAEYIGLQNQLVSVEWSVKPIVIEDRYDIVLKATFETDVPAAVVSIDPPNLNLPKMKSGDVMNGQFRLQNKGLIRADTVELKAPPSNANFKYELLAPVPTTLDAGEFVIVPYRVTCLKSPYQEEETGSGGGCTTISGCFTLKYTFFCSNGISYGGGFNVCASLTICTPDATPSKPSPHVIVIGPNLPGGGGTGPAYVSPTQIEGVCCVCDTDNNGHPDACWTCDANQDGKNDTCSLCDTNGDGKKDGCYVCDTNSDGKPDSCPKCDTDGNGLPDSCYNRDSDDDGIYDTCCDVRIVGTQPDNSYVCKSCSITIMASGQDADVWSISSDQTGGAILSATAGSSTTLSFAPNAVPGTVTVRIESASDPEDCSDSITVTMWDSDPFPPRLKKPSRSQAEQDWATTFGNINCAIEAALISVHTLECVTPALWSGSCGHDGHVGNAVQHMYWACTLSRASSCSREKIAEFLQRHEEFKENDCSSGHPTMDFHNNEVGLANSSKDGSCLSLALESLNNGEGRWMPSTGGAACSFTYDKSPSPSSTCAPSSSNGNLGAIESCINAANK